jgi:uncharacterized membrane protein YqjE
MMMDSAQIVAMLITLASIFSLIALIIFAVVDHIREKRRRQEMAEFLGRMMAQTISRLAKILNENMKKDSGQAGMTNKRKDAYPDN